MCDVYINNEHRYSGSEGNKRHELYLKERQGLGIISSVIQNDQMSVT